MEQRLLRKKLDEELKIIRQVLLAVKNHDTEETTRKFIHPPNPLYMTESALQALSFFNY